MRAVIEGAVSLPITDNSPTAANGIIYGQYRAPIFEFLFEENRPGFALVTNNFQSMPFLVEGGSSSSFSGIIVDQLNPWPGLFPPPQNNGGCIPPAPNAGGPYTVTSEGQITLSGSIGAGTSTSVLWSLPLGLPASEVGSLSQPASAITGYTAPQVLDPAGRVITVTFSVTSPCVPGGSIISTADIRVAGPTTPVVLAIPLVLTTGGTITVQLNGLDPDNLSLTFAVSQPTGQAATIDAVNSPGGLTGSVQLTVPALGVNVFDPVFLTFDVIATNTNGVISPVTTFTVQVGPAPDTILLVTQYRAGKQRLIITAATSFVNPAEVLTLQPYMSILGTMFDPTLLGKTFFNEGLDPAGGGAGVHTLVLVGAPQPAGTVQAVSNIGGASAPTPIQRLR
jgi:hypothetical protein